MTARTMTNDVEIESTRGDTFRKVMIWLVIASLVLVAGVQVYTSPKTVTIDSKHWSCTATEPNGIEAECTNFTKKKFGIRAE